MNQFKLFNNKNEILVFLLFLFVIFFIKVIFVYNDYLKFKSQKYAQYDADIISSYFKTDKKGNFYNVLKLKTDNFYFYTTSKKDLNLTNGTKVNLTAVTNNVKFKDYLGKTFYMPSFKIKKVKKQDNFKDNMINFISSQHQYIKIKELYKALYFAVAMSKELREDVTKWGIAHIISISGFHLGIIFGFSFIIFFPAYKFFQNRYFPYRSAKFDISIFVFILMTGYLYILDFTPSFLRSLVMCFIGFLFLIRNLKIFEFQTLFLSAALLVAFFPYLLFSVGFYFSCMGVFYIFLYTKHFWGKHNKITDALLLNIFVFLCMNVPVYYFFGNIALTQVAVIPISYIFVFFYPISIVLHVLRLGNMFDEYLIEFLNYDYQVVQINIPFLLFCFVNLASVVAVKYKYVSYILPLCGFAPLLFIK